jgi:DNA-binding NarL/FixJ family response regulator
MPLRILVVEDHAHFRRLTCEALRRREEFEIFDAADGSEALQKIEDLQPDLILLDINLPKLNGFEIAARIGGLTPNARVLFISQESAPEIVGHALRLGSHGYIHKPCVGSDLFPAIDAVLGGRRFVSASLEFPEDTSDRAPHRHEILFCPDDAAILDGLTRFIAAALNAADGAIVLATKSHRYRLLQRLRAEGVDIHGAIERGTYLSFDADETCVRLVDGINEVREAAARAGNPHPRIRFCGERAGRLWAAGRTAEAAQLEQLCRELAHDVDTLCLYPVSYMKDDLAIQSVCAGHTAIAASEPL